MSVGDDEREHAIVLLQDHYAKNRLEIDEFERRVEVAERARTGMELARATDGLPVIAVVVEEKPADIRATLGSVGRRGVWPMPRLVRVKAMFGNVELDLFDAELARGESVIEVSVTFGNVSIVVPDDIEVESEGSALLGSFEHMGQRARSTKDARKVKIVGRALFGSVDITVRKRERSLLDGIRDGVRGLLGR